jgi:outer membrane receptor for ferric coprogen and ferric-rhodotorulic acid
MALTAVVAEAQETRDELEPVLITAQRIDRVSRGATGLDLDIRDTPQSISFVTRDLMDQFNATNINSALRLATGVTVEDWETNRTNYSSRGFEIKNSQVDGVGLPNDWGIVTGAMDAYGYDKIEVIRGANGLLTGVGNASGTMNFVRKRPTNDAQAEVAAIASSWNGRRIEFDANTRLTDDGAWAARFVAAWDDQDSYLRSLQNNRLFIYGVVDGQVGERTTVALGYSHQQADTTGNLWGALVLANSDGSQAVFPRESSTTQDWTWWNTVVQNGFFEINFALSDNWTLKGSYNYRAASEDDQLFYAYTTFGLDPVTAEGLVGWPGKYIGGNHAHLGDLELTGRFAAWGQEHQLMLGISQASSSAWLDNFGIDPGEPAFGALPAFPYSGDVVPEPAWGAREDYSTLGQMMRRAYGAARLDLTDRLTTVLGFNWAEFSRRGTSGFGAPFNQKESQLSPYAGLSFDITGNLLAYASYSDIYQPQDQYDINEVYLDPSKGVNYEIGLKGEWLDRRLLTTFAWFKAKQENLATLAGINGNGNWYYEGVDVDSQGFEIEATGRLTEHLDLVFGFTSLDLEGADGEDIYKWVPRQTVNVSLVGRLPGQPQFSGGLNGRWQSDISTTSTIYTSAFDEVDVVIRQGSYALLNLFARWNFTDAASLQLNANNVTGEKYLTSLYSVGFYGAPTSYDVSFRYRF